MAETMITGLINKIAVAGCKTERARIVPPVPFIQFGAIERRMLNLNDYSNKIIEEYEQAMSAFDEQCRDIAQKAHMRVVGTRKKMNGTLIYKRMSVVKAERLERRRQRRLDAEKAFQNSDPYIITKIDNAWHCNIKTSEPEKRGLIFCTRSQKVRKNYKNVVHLKHTTTLDLAMSICSSFVKEGKPIEIIGKGKRRAVKCRSIHVENRRVLKVDTAHERCAKRSIDLKMDSSISLILEFLAIHTWKGRIISDQQVKKGMSGFVIPLAWFTADIPDANNSIFIVRGRDGDDLVDAREFVPRYAIDSIEHYSAAEQFWKGFDETFRSFRTTTTMHERKNNVLDVVRCGEVAGIICQSLMPCCRITCIQCANEYAMKSAEEVRTHIENTLNKGISGIQQRYPNFPHTIALLEAYKTMLNSVNTNREACGKVHFLIGDRTEQPFSHVLRVNEVLIKGNRATTSELNMASNELLEVARYLRNRTDNIKKGSLATFRNKVSAKAHINPSLMCDNQLDANGNFVWGKRGYHAKRFFANYFDVIQPADGYDKFIIRKFPNGSRKLAIQNLILPRNLDTLMKQLEGESIEPQPLTQSCISKRHERNIYPCCCVTLEDGTPEYSEFKAPTKNHIVLGNSGDSKYLDMPADISENLYIAKEGYCYINIFLAMLVNVDEKDAKDYTKWVRDVVTEQLKEWPTMIQVALACYQLSVLFPSVKSAELPRILVDHKTQTMHVIDSYGSATTGYHILKANTVSQLEKFASDTLESEMKHYRVGGLIEDNVGHHAAVKLLIQSVYKPKVLKTLLMEEPYLIVLSIISPSVLIALYKSGSLYRAVQMLQNKEPTLRMVISLLTMLATKVSRADDLYSQYQLIQDHAERFREVLNNGDKHSISRRLAEQFIEVQIAVAESNHDTESLGFRTTKVKGLALIEKIYQQDLEELWQGLSLLEKCSCILWQLRHRRKLRVELGENGTLDLSKALVTFKQYAQDNFDKVLSPIHKRSHYVTDVPMRILRGVRCRVVGTFSYLFSDLFRFVQVLAILSVLLAIFNNIYAFTCQYREFKMIEASREEEKKLESLDKLYAHLSYKLGEKPTFEEFHQFVSACNPQLVEFLEVSYAPVVEHQAVKRASEARLEQIVAFIALVMMIFDNDRSDCVYRVLNKFKNIVGIADQEVIHQSLDDIKTNFDESNETIDFELVTGETAPTPYKSTVFSDWWSNQLNMGRTIPHYRTEGHFMEFTRDTVATVVSNIIQSEKRDFLIRGAVGSGKSTGLPAQLAKKGKVLIVEPTRPLSENVFTQLRSQPFHLSPTLLMRNSSHFGSTPISIMTSGYALHYLANSGTALNTFDFIIMDECHVLDANAMALYSLLHDREYTGKILKVSATPPGREVEFKTQFPVKLKIEESLSFQQFVEAQGTGTNSDVTDEADNILVYVSSYNEVDQLSKMLGLKGYKVTKVDGRTMKNGSTSIKTPGTSAKKHFIVATNIIENGVTLDIEAVVDFGMKVSPSLDVDGRRIMYSKVCINYGERIQRLGRVGRVKPGVALRIGSTQEGIEAIPNIIATEAAFSCFVYGLPVMTSQVSTSLLSRCTVQQAKTAMLFELPSYFMINLIDANGSMYPHIHEVPKKFKLRESEIQLNKMAIPYAVVNQWLTVTEYNRSGNALQIAPECRIPFLVKEIPDTLYEKLWQVVTDNKGDAGFRRLTTHNAARVAYKLRTDEHSLQKTIGILNQLIIAEREKQAHFESLASFSLGSQCYSLQSICNAYKSRYAKNHTTENISVLEAARAQLIEFSNVYGESIYVGEMSDLQIRDEVVEFGALETVVHQSKDEIAAALKLKSRWNKSLITRDLLVCFGVAAGGAWMIYQYLMDRCNEVVEHQGKNKKGAQRLKFRNARDAKVGRVVFDDDSGAVEHLFGAAYTKKGKKTGKAVGLGKKTRRFVNMYGFDPTEYTFVRFVDPVTGEMIDENPVTDIKLVEEHFDDIRFQHLQDEKVPIQALYSNPGLTAYFVKDKTSPVLKVDLTHHVPLKLCDNSSTIAGFPEKENMLRQTGAAKPIDFSELPILVEGVDHEAKSLNKGLRDYNSVAKCICLLENDSDGSSISIHGIGFGPLIITNRHLLKRNNGTLTVKSLHGEFKVVNSASIRVFPVENCDILILRMPKDFPPFPSKLKFRAPKTSDVVCLVGSNFQEKYTSSMVSSSSNISHVANSSFWRHWIDTQSGHCGLPLVSLSDGNLIGIHSLMSVHSEHNMFTGFPETFSECIAKTDNIVWARGWKYNPSEISWGNLKLKASAPTGLFKTSKLIEDLHREMVEEQSHERWVYDALHGNLKAVAASESQLVTKHVVKGECQLFQLYLNNHPEAAAFFRPLMGFYQKSKLNKVAYLKDFLKYATVIEVGVVDPETFELAVSDTVQDLKRVGFPECDYVTDESTIFQALNMKSAVGALYKGKKRHYFSAFTLEQMEQIVQDSCERLYSGKLGVWNGSIKAELRPKEKVLENKTRTFTAAPLDTLLAGKVCVDDFNNFFYSFNLKGPWSVGMSKFTRGWDTLLQKLPNGWLYCDADGSRFDSSLTPYLINAVLQIRLTFMEPWDIGEQMLKNLYAEIIYTPILAADGTIVKKFKGNNSGQPSTVVDNTLMVIITMHYALRRAGISYENFSEHCAFVANGDDLIIAVAPGSEHILDTLQGSFHELGLNYDFSSRTHNKEELCFMSHYGVPRENCLIPKLEQERIVSILEWDRATEPQHRLEAICAAMVEAWGYDELLYNIRLFYAWVLEQAPYNELARQGMAPYISENALRRLYLGEEGDISLYLQSLVQNQWKDEQEEVVHQGDNQTVDAGKNLQSNQKQGNAQAGNTSSGGVKDKDKDVNVGTSGTFSIPRLRGLSTKLNLPRIKGKEVVNLQHLLEYTPDQVSLSNTRALNSQFASWYEGVKGDYDLDDAQMEIVLNGLMVWCIENGTSPNLNGMWVMMDGDEQVEYPIKPLLEHAKPTFRQIMAHFSNLAEAYIEKRNAEKPYMPRYGLQRNLTDMTLARYAFDFYEINSRTPTRAREAHIQMKAAAVANSKNNLFGLDGNVSTKEENTERHTATDVNRNMHHLLGVSGV
uniref:Genome polyprotein n=2 Tax=Tobacco vein banding mosaic virus TaxID=33765 RepID=I7C376_9POTV|nr:polyprotein [Tobacco vein banding mosaic virus]